MSATAPRSSARTRRISVSVSQTKPGKCREYQAAPIQRPRDNTSNPPEASSVKGSRWP
jgi:hypothetical protein